MGYESYLRKRRIPSFLTGLSLRLRADISKVIAHERIQLAQPFKSNILDATKDGNSSVRILQTSQRSLGLHHRRDKLLALVPPF
jgi:hypothetical protein